MPQPATPAVIHSSAPDSLPKELPIPPSSPVLSDLYDQAIERALSHHLPSEKQQPESLHRAMRHAVLSGGKRLRPKLLLHVAVACGARSAELDLAVRVACAIELIHCASLVHDDLPCFDDAAERRGVPTVHRLFGEPIAVLAGDALLSLAFELLADTPAALAPRALRLIRLLGEAAGSTLGIIGGQSLEQHGVSGAGAMSESLSAEPMERYHEMKTGALFRLAAEAGAVAAGAANPKSWGEVGRLIGKWYQLADDWMDVYGQQALLGKPTGQDATHGRPNAVLSRGEVAVRTELSLLLKSVEQRVSALCGDAGPLLSFLSALHLQILKVMGVDHV